MRKLPDCRKTGHAKFRRTLSRTTRIPNEIFATREGILQRQATRTARVSPLPNLELPRSMTCLRLLSSAIGVTLLTVMNSSALPLPMPERGFVSSKPASIWEESLICGNGTIGMLTPSADRSTNASFSPMSGSSCRWATPVVPPDQSAHLPEIRKLIAEGKYKEAATLQFKSLGPEGLHVSGFLRPGLRPDDPHRAPRARSATTPAR